MFNCSVCKTSFETQIALARHNSTSEKCLTINEAGFPCSSKGCEAKYHRKDYLLKHERKKHGKHKNLYKPKRAFRKIILPSAGVLHEPPPIRDLINIRMIVQNVIPPEHKVAKFFEAVRPNVAKMVGNALKQFHQMIFDVGIRTKLLQGPAFINGKANIYEVKTFEAVDIKLRCPTMIQNTLDVVFKLITEECAEEVNKCDLNTILDCHLCFSRLKPPIGRYIPVSPALLPPEAVVNVENADSYCFKWVILAALSEHSEDLPVVTSYGIPDISAEKLEYKGLTLDFSRLGFPMEVRDMEIFESKNPTLSVNVFGVVDQDVRCLIVGPLYRTRLEKERHINLLYFEQMNRTVNHFAAVRSLSILLKRQIPKKLQDIYDICNSCLSYFATHQEFEEHRVKPLKCKAGGAVEPRPQATPPKPKTESKAEPKAETKTAPKAEPKAEPKS